MRLLFHEAMRRKDRETLTLNVPGVSEPNPLAAHHAFWFGMFYGKGGFRRP